MLTKKVFKDLAIYMIGFGVAIGIIFPFFVVFVTAVPPSEVLTPLFFSMCITAGFLVGLFNIFLAKKNRRSQDETIILSHEAGGKSSNRESGHTKP